VAWTSRLPSGFAGGIEACVAEVVPRLRLLRPDWEIRAVHAFERSSVVGRVPLVCDILAAFILAARTRDEDVVVVNGAEYAFVRLFVPRWRRATIVVWHGTRAAEIPALAPRMTLPIRIYAWTERILQRLAYMAPRHLAVGDAVRDELLEAYGRAPEIVVVPNGVGPATAGRAAARSAPHALWVGSNAYKKGLDIAIEACRLARRAAPDLRLVIAGLAGVAASGEPWIRNVGVVPHERMMELLDCADVVLTTTRYEACSVAVLEAMARGKAIVGSRSVAWMFGEDAAPDGAPAFAEAIARALTPEGRAELEARSLRALRRFDWENAVAVYARAIEQLL